MSITQHLPLLRPDPRPDGPCRRSAFPGPLSGLLASAALIICAIPGRAQAQNRSEVQVAAQVLATTASLEALDLVSPSGDGSRRWDTSLATIEVDYLIQPSVADSLADRPRAVVIVSFLRN